MTLNNTEYNDLEEYSMTLNNIDDHNNQCVLVKVTLDNLFGDSYRF